METFVKIENCAVKGQLKNVLKNVSWQMKDCESWLIIGANGSGKSEFVSALDSQNDAQLKFVPNELSILEQKNAKNPEYFSIFDKKTMLVSLENAAKLIEKERALDESEILNREDEGRTARRFISEVLGGAQSKNAPLSQEMLRLETRAEVALCGIQNILDRGLRYLSTGEIRRTLLCRALLSGAGLLILSDPFAGLDVESREIFLEFFNTLLKRQNQGQAGMPKIILVMERFTEIPDEINCVLEFSNGGISFCGERKLYENNLKLLAERESESKMQKKREFILELKKIRREFSTTNDISLKIQDELRGESLVKFENVNVGWGENKVLVNLNWEVKSGEHWLLRGPNGAGKTTILELITGDNMQVFREKIYIFGKRRGSGETIWDIKRNLGIVSYRLHVEYRMVGGTTLQNVIISGFYDSIGLYEQPGDFEILSARAWLRLAGFAGRENEAFSNLSYGEQRAALILRAAVKSPRVLILDEPCHGLDENFREKILALLETIAETGTTTLLHVTHDKTEVLSCEHKVLELKPKQNPMYSILKR